MDVSPRQPKRVRFLIAGMARSGTTLIQRLVSEFESVWVPPETHFWRHANALSRRFPPPLDTSTARAALGWFLSLPSSDGIDVGIDDVCAGLQEPIYLWDLFESVVGAIARADVECLGEKTPDHLLWANQLLEAIPDLKVIGVVRDPRELLRSHRDVPWGITEASALAEKWVHLARALGDCQRRFPDRVLALRYETVRANPDEARESIGHCLGVDNHRTEIPRSSDGLFMAHEWWKEKSLATVENVPDTWSQELSDSDVATIQHRAEPEMHFWGYETQELSEPPKLTSSLRADAVRGHIATIAHARLPITAAQLGDWEASEQRSSQRWEERARQHLSDKRSLESDLRSERASRKALEGWKTQAKKNQAVADQLQELNAETLERIRSLEAARDQQNLRIKDIQRNAESHRTAVLRERLLRLKAQRERRVAIGKLSRLRARRWWKLAGILSEFRKHPWRVDRLVAAVFRLVTGSHTLPPEPDLSSYDRKRDEIQAQISATTVGQEALASAQALYRAGDLEATLELLAADDRTSALSSEALDLARDCYIKMGELTKALACVRRLLRIRANSSLSSQARVLEGRLR
ncbi:MAG: hypothetical protein DWP92_04800 [Armatimonadetes bacterium]|nr:MAG: hypothetical protein DWP92_04800 [Armatimonadota bacterium]